MAPLPRDQRDDLTEFERGYVACLRAYAWWKNGVQYVGTTGSTLREAEMRFLARPDRAAPTSRDELEAARRRLQPYLDGYPEPMIDTRRLRIANGNATEQDIREIAAEDHVLREIREQRPGR